MNEILDRILAIHNDPKIIITDPLADGDFSARGLLAFVEEDKDGWFIRHNGQHLLYLNKQVTSMDELELRLTEVWARFTKKNINQVHNKSQSAYLV